MKIQKTLKITVTQADVEAAIIEMIAQEDPTIVVDEIQFTPKRAGKDAIAVKIEAHIGDEAELEEDEDEALESEPEPEPEVVVPEIVEEEDEAPFDVEPEPAPEPPARTKLFG